MKHNVNLILLLTRIIHVILYDNRLYHVYLTLPPRHVLYNSSLSYGVYLYRPGTDRYSSSTPPYICARPHNTNTTNHQQSTSSLVLPRITQDWLLIIILLSYDILTAVRRRQQQQWASIIIIWVTQQRFKSTHVLEAPIINIDYHGYTNFYTSYDYSVEYFIIYHTCTHVPYVEDMHVIILGPLYYIYYCCTYVLYIYIILYIYIYVSPHFDVSVSNFWCYDEDTAAVSIEYT